MKRYFCLFAAFFSLLGTTAGVCAGEAKRSPAVSQRVLPERIGAWSCKAAEQASALGAPGASAAGPNYAEIWKEADAKTPENCEYTSGAKSVQVMLEKYGDPSGAYEVYTAYLTPEMQPSILGKFSAVDREKLIALVGSFVLSVRQPKDIPTADLESLAKAVRTRADQTPLPPMRAFLPEEGLVQGTQRYALGPAGLRNSLDALLAAVFRSRNAAGTESEQYLQIADQVAFQSGAETMLAEYRSNKESAVLLLIDYPTPQIAELRSRHIATALPEQAKRDGTKIERKGSLLSIVLAASSEGYADKVRNAVNFETTVTWNEPSQTATDPPWSVILYRIFVGTGIFMVAAVVLGIAFGGLRVFTKRILPGKVFDRADRMEVLQLGLSGKTIDPRDFY